MPIFLENSIFLMQLLWAVQSSVAIQNDAFLSIRQVIEFLILEITIEDDIENNQCPGLEYTKEKYLRLWS